MADLALLVLACAALRGAGLALAGRMGPDHPFIQWAAAVALATLAAFVATALAAPTGALATLPTAARLAGLLAGLAWWARNGGLLAPVTAGSATAAVLGWAL